MATSQPLYVLVPYFNHCGFATRRRLLLEFLERMHHTQGIEVVVIEGISSSTGVLPDPLPFKCLAHVKVPICDYLWYKENLINIGVGALPDDWSAIAWIDPDVAFKCHTWVSDTWEALQRYDMVQMWSKAHFLDATNNVMHTFDSFGRQYCKRKSAYRREMAGAWHPGYAWAMKRSAYETMGGLPDWLILGGADRHIALAFIQQVALAYPEGMCDGHARKAADLEERVKGLQLGFVEGLIMHFWHGSPSNRQYDSRWEFLANAQYDPYSDICYTSDGVLSLTHKGARLQNGLIKYFESRLEDA